MDIRALKGPVNSIFGRQGDIIAASGDYSIDQILYTHETVSRTIYISTTGNDITGDGSVGNPYATLLKAFQTIKYVVDTGVVITIQFAPGTYTPNWPSVVTEMARIRLIEDADIIIKGAVTKLTDGFTLTPRSPEAYIYDVTGATWTANVYQDKFLKVGSQYVPIESNGTTTANSFPGAGAATEIYEPNVIFNNITDVELIFDYPAVITQRMTIQFVKFNTSGNSIRIASKNVTSAIKECTFVANDVEIDEQTGQHTFTRCNFILDTGGIDQRSARNQFNKSIVRKVGTRAGTGVSYTNNYQRPERSLYISNYSIGIAFASGNFVYNQTSHYQIIDATTAFTIRNDTFVTFTIETIFLIGTITTLISNGETMYHNYGFYVSTLVGSAPTNYLSAALDALGYIDVNKNIKIRIPLTSQSLYEDLVMPLTQAKLGATAKPDFDETNLGYLFPQNDTSEILFLIMQLPHSYEEGSTIFPHVHVQQSANQQAVFKIDYKWFNIGDSVPAGWTTVTLNTYHTVYSSGNLHQVLKSASGISGTGKTVSSILLVKLYRDDNVYTGDMLTFQFDMHYLIDANGSPDEWIK